MFLKKFIKKQFVSFYYDEKYILLIQIYKNNKLLNEISIEFQHKKELKEKISYLSKRIPQTFISTVIQTVNQGIIPTCKKKEFLDFNIEIDNIKYICINNKYALYTSIFDILETQKLNTDFIYSIFALIDYKAKKKINSLYLLITKQMFYIVIYNENKALYSDIFENTDNISAHNEEENDLIDDFSDDIDIIEDLENDIIEDIDDLDEIQHEQKKTFTNIEKHILHFLKESIEEYYKAYGDDFIEEITVFDTINISNSISETIDNTFFIETKKINFDILEIINEISRQNV